ncbi:MAG: hypothetical protein ABL985_12795 [Casimicrobium sp.]
MSNPNGISNEKRVDPVVDAYRQASTREGAGPSAAVRAAVLAHARVVADANATGAPRARYIAPNGPAANDHSWMWRAAAGLVLGVLGVLMFQWMRPNGSATETNVAAAPAVVPAAPAAPVAATPPSETVAAQSPEPRSSTPPTASTSAPPPVSTDPTGAEKLAVARSMESAADRARASANSTVIEPTSVREDRIGATTVMNAAKTAKAQAPASDSVANAAPAAASPMPAAAVAAAPVAAAAAPPPSAAPASPPAASPMPSPAIGASAAVAAAAAPSRYEIAARGDIAMATPKRAPAGNAERTQVAGDTGNAIDSFAKKSVSKPQFENTEARRPSASAVASVGARGAADAPRARDSFGAAPAAKASVAPSTRGTLSAIDAELLRSTRLNDLDAVRAAVARGANVNARDDAGRSALQIARADDLATMVDLLVALGAR